MTGIWAEILVWAGVAAAYVAMNLIGIFVVRTVLEAHRRRSHRGQLDAPRARRRPRHLLGTHH